MEGKVAGRIGRGFLVLVGAEKGDGAAQAYRARFRTGSFNAMKVIQVKSKGCMACHIPPLFTDFDSGLWAAKLEPKPPIGARPTPNRLK